MNLIPFAIAFIGGLLLVSSGVVLVLMRHWLWRRVTNAAVEEKNPYSVGAVVMGLTLILVGLAALVFFISAFFAPVATI